MDPQRQLSQIGTPIKPLSHRERCFAQKHAIFLLRNLEKVRRRHLQQQSAPGTPTPGAGDAYNKTGTPHLNYVQESKNRVYTPAGRAQLLIAKFRMNHNFWNHISFPI